MFIPPLAVYMHTRSTLQTVLNLILLVFFWIPAVIHAFFVIFDLGGRGDAVPTV